MEATKATGGAPAEGRGVSVTSATTADRFGLKCGCPGLVALDGGGRLVLVLEGEGRGIAFDRPDSGPDPVHRGANALGG